jgi:hypothetical protein
MNASPAPPYLTVPRLARIPWLVHGFGTRHWTSAGLRALSGRVDSDVAWLKQTHSARLHFVESASRGRRRGDALATDRPGIILVTRTADCLPVFLVDRSKRVVAAVHCGWRGTRQRILERTVSGLIARYGCRPDSLLAALGPCIDAPCYEVGDDVRDEFRAGGLAEGVFQLVRPGKYLFDLREANRRQLSAAGLAAGRIFDVALCTRCEPRLHSFRRDRDASARLYNFIGIKGGT